MNKDIITMSTEEIKRHGILKQVLEGQLQQKEAAEIIGISSRQARRLMRRIEKEGVAGVMHRSRGRPGSRRVAAALREKIVNLYKSTYHDFGPTFAAEKLEEVNGIRISHDTLRNWLLDEEEAPCWQRRKRPHRQWRERKTYYGEMLQLDGSHHDWLEGRGPKMVLMGLIDDATGKAFGRFYKYEGTYPALDSMYRYIRCHGIPLSVYLDRHSTYKAQRRQTISEELMNKQALSQFARAMKELGVHVLYAHSPEAKGRVERLFRTLQDRLVKELRLAGTKTLEEANQVITDYMPRFNVQFRKPAKKKTDVHRKAPKKRELDSIVSIQEQRVLQKDSTIRYKTKCYLLVNAAERSMKKVIIEERLDGSVHIRHNHDYLKYKEIDKSLILHSIEQEETSKKKENNIPPANHCWRYFRIKKYPHIHTNPQKEKVGQKEKITTTR